MNFQKKSDLWPETWHLRHSLHFWQLRTTMLTITLWPLNKEWRGQHSQFLRCFMLIIYIFEMIMIMSFLRRLILEGKVLSKTAQLTVFARWKELCWVSIAIIAIFWSFCCLTTLLQRQCLKMQLGTNLGRPAFKKHWKNYETALTGQRRALF